jgi:hypothetical protein
MSSVVKWQDFFTERGKKERKKEKEEKGKKKKKKKKKEKEKEKKVGKQKALPFHMIHTN